MASNNAVQALLKPTSEHGRNLFPLDNRHVYSQKAGHITPVKAIHFEPGTHLDITAHDFTLTFPMQTAPFLRGRKEFSFYSVYYNAVWSLFNQYQSTRQDPKTSAFGTNPTLQEPRIRLTDLYFACMVQFFDYVVYEDIIPAWIDSLENPLLNANREKAIAEARTEYLSSEHQIFTASFTYVSNISLDEHVFSYSLTNTYVGDFVPSKNGQSFQGLVSEYAQDVVGHFRIYNWVRKLDMLGYGNLYPFFRSFENTILTLLDGAYDSALSQISILFTERMGYLRSISARNWNTDSPIYKMVNLYPICAYNAIFYHFFRNSYYDLGYYNHDYNLDFVSVDSQHGDYNRCGMSDFSLRFLDIEYHQWKKDTFTAVLPDTQFGAVSSINLSVVSGSSELRYRFDDGTLLPDASAPNVSTGYSGTAGSDLHLTNYYGPKIIHDHAVDTSFDVIALKRAEMLQEYRQQLLRAGNKTSDVFRAIYGKAASSEHEDDIIPRFLDTFGEDIFVDPVQSTANTGSENPNGQLGDIAARGKFRGDSQMIKFNAGGNFGLILVLSYVVPTAEYNSYMLDKHILELTPEDHFIPQFENLGLEPIYTDELNMLTPANSMQVLGYAPRYHHKKSEVDLAHGAFCSWLPSFNSPERNLGFFGDFNNWVSPRTDLQNRVSTSVRDFYVNPSVLDNVFVRAAGADQADDQFICNTFFEVNAIKEMSKIGLINFV